MEDYLEYLAVKVYAGRYDGRIAGIRKAFEDYQANMRVSIPLPVEPSRWIIAGALIIGGCLGGAVAWGIMGVV